jgi:hypothetical protein
MTIAPSGSLVGGVETRPINTPLQAGAAAAELIAAGRGVSLTGDSVTVIIPPVGLAIDGQQVSTTATISTATIPTLDVVLTGTNQQVSNAAAFVAIATAAQFSLDQITTGISIALTGANFSQVATLIDSIAELMVVSASQPTDLNLSQAPTPALFASALLNSKESDLHSIAQLENADPTETITINPSRLNIAIMAFNQIIDGSDDATIIALSKNPEFLTIGNLLKRLRMAI